MNNNRLTKQETDIYLKSMSEMFVALALHYGCSEEEIKGSTHSQYCDVEQAITVSKMFSKKEGNINGITSINKHESMDAGGELYRLIK